MSIVDLSRRVTFDWDKYNKNSKSFESYIFVNSEENCVIQVDTSINITVGDVWYDSKKNTDIKMTEKGVKVKSKKYVVFQSQQYLGLPYNVYGIVVGKGANIFNGGVISTGKIVPGYKGALRIGYYNASNSTIVLHKNDVLGCCVFFSTETTATNENMGGRFDNVPALEVLTRRAKIFEWFCENWYNILSLLLSVAAIIVAIFLN